MAVKTRDFPICDLLASLNSGKALVTWDSTYDGAYLLINEGDYHNSKQAPAFGGILQQLPGFSCLNCKKI